MAAAKELHMEVIMAHSAYARAAGLQSEVNKITVTRVAGNEVEYKRQLNLYRKDMMITIGNIQREEKRLKKSMVKYRGKMRKNRHERKRREKEDFERDRRAMDNINNVLIVQTPSEINTQPMPTVEEGSPDSGIGEELVPDSKDESTTDGNYVLEEDVDECNDSTKRVKKKVKRLRKGGEDSGSKTYITLPVINEDMEDLEDKQTDDKVEETETQESLLGKVEVSGPQSDNSENKSSGLPELLNMRSLPRKALRPKRQVVSFADLIKLQHSTSTKKLFDLVHILAEKHGVKDEQIKIEKENRNIVALRSTEQGISESMMRAASVLYPMKFGYVNNHTENVDEPTSPLSTQGDTSTENSGLSSPEVKHSDKLYSPRVNFRRTDTNDSGVRNISRQTEPTLPSVRSTFPKENMKRNNSLPTLLDQVEKIKKEKEQSLRQKDHDNGNRRHSMSKSSSSTPRLLPPLERKRLSMGNVYAQRNDAVSWTEAFGLLKGVHNLLD